jgi:hypothetical protein
MNKFIEKKPKFHLLINVSLEFLNESMFFLIVNFVF